MSIASFPERDKLEDLLEIYFPKNKCKERGQALVMIAMFIIWLGKRKKLPEFLDLK